MASNEQQQTAKESEQDQEEEEAGDVLMDTEEELLRAEDTEQLKPEAVKSDTASSSGESLAMTVVNSRLCSFCPNLWRW